MGAFWYIKIQPDNKVYIRKHKLRKKVLIFDNLPWILLSSMKPIYHIPKERLTVTHRIIDRHFVIRSIKCTSALSLDFQE